MDIRVCVCVCVCVYLRNLTSSHTPFTGTGQIISCLDYSNSCLNISHILLLASLSLFSTHCS